MVCSNIGSINFRGQVQSQALTSLINSRKAESSEGEKISQPEPKVEQTQNADETQPVEETKETQRTAEIQPTSAQQNPYPNLSPMTKDVFGYASAQAQPETVKQTLIKSGIGIASLGIMLAMVIKAFPKMMSRGLNFEETEGVQKIWEDISDAAKIEDMILPDTLKEILLKTKNAISNPTNLHKRGGKAANSILLYGPPGTGKTTFAKALAREFPDAQFASVDITKLNSKYHGETGKRINAAIDAICDAAKAAPDKKFFVFIDEIDSVMMVDDGLNGKLSNDILNEFKKCFTEKLGKQKNIITIGATNFTLDVEKGTTQGGKFLDRPMLDRFEQKILVDLPNSDQILQAINKHYKDCELVDSALKTGSDDRLKKLCDFLAKKEHNFSFRTLNSIYNDTAARLTGESSVGFEDIVKTIEGKKAELHIKEKDWADLMGQFGIAYTPKKDASGKIPIGFRA